MDTQEDTGKNQEVQEVPSPKGLGGAPRLDAEVWNDKINDLSERLRPVHGGGSLAKLIAMQEQPGRAFDLIGNLRDALKHYDHEIITAHDFARVVDGLIVAYTDHPYVLPFDTAANWSTLGKAGAA